MRICIILDRMNPNIAQAVRLLSERGVKVELIHPEKQLINFELRQRLCQAGLTIGVAETSEVLGNPTGGLRQGARYEGLTDLNLRRGRALGGFAAAGDFLLRPAAEVMRREALAPNGGRVRIVRADAKRRGRTL